MQIIYLDLAERRNPAVVYAKQGDVGRKVQFELTDNGASYMIPAYAAFSVWYSGCSGEGNYTGIGERSAFTVEENQVTVELAVQMLQNPGGGIFCLVLSDVDGNQLGLWNMTYVSESVPGAGSSAVTDYYTALSEIAQQALTAAKMVTPDTTLAVSGVPADSKAVGAALDKKAPAGYGLGTRIHGKTSFVNNVNNELLPTGFYYCGVGTENVPDESFGGGPLFVINWQDGTLCCQYLMNNDLSQKYTRRFQDGEWLPWEYINPPLVHRVLYRTPERHDGKPVYVYRYCVEKMPNATDVGYPTDISCETYPNMKVIDMQFSVRINGNLYVNNFHLVEGNLEMRICESLNHWYLMFKTDFDGTAGEFDVTLKMTLD